MLKADLIDGKDYTVLSDVFSLSAPQQNEETSQIDSKRIVLK
jgi:hypothetical protein